MALMDAAYLLGGVTDLRSVGMGQIARQSARLYFGAEQIDQAVERIVTALGSLGYLAGRTSHDRMCQVMSLAFLLNRSPYLADVTHEVLDQVGKESTILYQSSNRLRTALQQVQVLAPRQHEHGGRSRILHGDDVDPLWYSWCLAWYEQAVDLTPRIRAAYASQILATGRWLVACLPHIRSPEQWTEEVALQFRVALESWTTGQYVGCRAQRILAAKGTLGTPIQAGSVGHYLDAMRRFLRDLSRHVHAPTGQAPQKVTLDFDPLDTLVLPHALRLSVDAVDPRDVDLRLWAKLVIAAATLAPGDLPPGAKYPLSFYRALSLLWVTSARRPNELTRLRLACLREEWEPTMIGEDEESLEKPLLSGASHNGETTPAEQQISYLHIPSGKNRGPFWIWIPEYVADAIKVWQRERPASQHALYDPKDRAYVDFLFCYRNKRVGINFINHYLIPKLCSKAGVDQHDARGRITGHRGRSTRLTLLRHNGVHIEDLAEYAGHTNTKTLRRYVRQNPLQLHRIIQAADDTSRIIEGVIDIQAAAQGLPALRWFIGYDTDGDPMFCGNQVYMTCPHRLDCERCGMFIGGEKARLLQEEEHTLPISSVVPMTPIETCVVNRDQEGAEACRATLQQVPAPETPDIHLIFNPEGLSDGELHKLALLGTPEAREKLHQALQAHEKRLTEMTLYKSGRNALVGAQRKRIDLIRQLIVECYDRISDPKGERGWL